MTVERCRLPPPANCDIAVRNLRLQARGAGENIYIIKIERRGRGDPHGRRESFVGNQREREKRDDRGGLGSTRPAVDHSHNV